LSSDFDTVYLNPQPINIAKAEATRDGSTLNVFVEKEGLERHQHEERLEADLRVRQMKSGEG
jgi:hypothetical protein